MKRLSIDFAHSRTWLRPRGSALEWLLCGLALSALAAVLVLWYRIEDLRANQAQELVVAGQKRQAALRNVPPPPVQPTIGKTRAVAVNGAIMQLNLPWRALNQALGRATSPAVALLALEPDARKRSLRLTAETRSNANMLDYIDQLKREPFFTEVALLEHDYDERDPARPLRFQLNLAWRAEP